MERADRTAERANLDALQRSVESYRALNGSYPGNPAQEYGRALTGSMERADRTADRANLEALQRSVESYHALNGSYPESLDEITQQMGLDASLFDYNSETGKVTLK